MYARKNYTTVEICLNSKGLFTWRWGTPGKGDNLLSGVNCLPIKSLIWSPHLSCKRDQIQIQLPHLRLTFWISRMDGMDDRMRAKIKTQTKSIGLPTKCKEIPGAEINPLKNPMPKFEALKISRKH